MVFDTFSDTQTLCRPGRYGNATCRFSNTAFLFGSDIIGFRSVWNVMHPIPFPISNHILGITRVS